MKLPALQFYPGDWWKDPGVKTLSLQERGFWLQCLMLMHEADERGKLTVNGRPYPMESLAMIMGLRPREAAKIVEKLVAHGVASMDANGVLFSRRMVRDEDIRRIRAEAGSKGGNPALLLNQKVNQPAKQTPTPSVSVSVSSSVSDSTTPPITQKSTPPSDPAAPVLTSAKGTLEELKAYAIELQLPESDGAYLFDNWTANGWTRNGQKIKCWKSAFRTWKSGGWLPSQKGSNGGRTPSRNVGTPLRAEDQPRSFNPLAE